MCGIAGIIGPLANAALVKKLLEPIAHRGDLEHFGEIRAFPAVAFGTNRLAIIDEQNGQQPSCSQDDEALCVHNGEIYNHQVLHAEFAKHTAMQTKCDTEVVLHAFLTWGPQAILHLEGMYAVAFCNRRTGEWFLARDPLGIKPLYFMWLDGSLFFASEVKALVGISSEGEIRELPPGCVLDQSGVSQVRRIPTFSDEPKNDEDALLRIRDHLIRAVRTHLPPPGNTAVVLLSGGIDSSTVLLLVRNLHNGPVVAFTLANNQVISADLVASRTLCEQLGVPLYTVNPPASSLASFYLNHGVEMSETLEPPLVRNATTYHFLCREVHKFGYKSCLSGEGADELFAGYDYFKRLAPQHITNALEVSLREIHRTYLLVADRASMRTSVEVRVPYMDYGFVTAAASVGLDQRLRGDIDKWLLRNLFNSELPEINRTRPKIGMNGGAGFGSNDPGEGIYATAVDNHYTDGRAYAEDLRIVENYGSGYGIDITNREEVFTFARYHQQGFCRLVKPQRRPQLNTRHLAQSGSHTLSVSGG